MSDPLLDEKLAFDAMADRNRECPYCRGEGYNYLDGGRVTWKCPDCHGTGKQLQQEDE